MIQADLRERVRAWLADDPDPRDRAELAALLDEGGETAGAELADRFADRLRFGTAGLRGAVAAGPNRMNRAVVRAATVAVARWLRAHDPAAAKAGVVVGCDARHRSDEFTDEVARVLAGAGVRVHLLPRRQPTPLLAFAVRHLAAAAGIMITASHNPPADNGYKLYLADGAQIVPPVDAQIEALIGAAGPLALVPLAPLDSPLVTSHGGAVAAAYLAAVTAVSPAPTALATADAGHGGPGGTPTPAPARGLATAPTHISAPPPAPATGQADAATPAAAHEHAPEPAPAARPTAAASAEGRVPAPLRVVYTPMHGVAGDLAVEAMRRAGFQAPDVVAVQAAPDPDFPTVAFPNPELPGALEHALAQARRIGADLVLANDPDGDRLAVAVPDRAPGGGPADPAPGRIPDGTAADGWRVLTGDQVGALLGAYLLERTAAEPDPHARLVATTIVSSTLLSRIAAAAGVRYAQTLTGFKWIVRAGDRLPGSRFVFGYEEAIGYVVGEVVRDKDGIGAALAVLGLAATAKSAGQSLLDRYDALESAHGVHLTAQLTLATADPDAVMARLRAATPATLAGQPVTATADLAGGDHELPPADVLSYRLGGGRVVVRPSGTEPKIKAYLEIVEPVGEGAGQLARARARARARLDPLRDAVQALLTG